MNVTYIITIVSVLIIASMIMSGISYNRQQAMKRRKAKINRFKQQADELIGIISLLLKIDKEYGLICQLQNIVSSSLQAAHQLAPDDPLISSHCQTQSQRASLFNSGKRENKVNCYTTNDSELNQAMSLFTQLGKILDIYKNKGVLSAAKHQELSAHLQTLRVDLDINSNLYQADNFAVNGDITMYQMHLKQALEVLKKSTIESNEKHERIKFLSEMLTEVKKTNAVIGGQKLLKPQEATPKTDNKFKY